MLLKCFDVVVVGAGPAGCAAAISCAQRGLRVALIERQRFPRFRPGESLHPGIEPLLQQLGVNTLLLHQQAMRFAGHWVQWNGPARFHALGSDEHGPWRGFQMARAQLDATLLRQAEELGVTVHQPCQARHVLKQDNRIVGLTTTHGPFSTSCLIDASGAASWLSRQLHLKTQVCSPPMVARYGYLQGCIAPYETAPHLLAHARGWTWIAQVQKQRLHWTHLDFETPRSAPQKDVSRMLPQALQTLPPIGPIRGADVTWRISTAAAGTGYFMVGDAASVLDPASSHGVLKALMTGMQAAQAVFDCLRQPALQASAQTHYCQWLNHWFERDSEQLRHFYRQHPYPPRWLTET